MKRVSIISKVFRFREDHDRRDARQNYRVLMLLLSVGWLVLMGAIRYYETDIVLTPWVLVSVPTVYFGLFLFTFKSVPLAHWRLRYVIYGGFYFTVAMLLYLHLTWGAHTLLLFGLGINLLLTSIFFESRLAYVFYIGTTLPALFGVLLWEHGLQWEEILYPLTVIGLVGATGFLYLHLNYQTQRQLREKDHLMKSFYQFATEAMLITTPKGQIVDANENACRLLKGTPSSLHMVDIGRFFTESYSEVVMERILSTVKEKGHWYDKVEVCSLANELFWGELTIRRITVNREKLFYFTLANETSQLMHRAAQQAREVKYRLMMEEATDGILLLNEQGQVLEGNQKAGKLLHTDVNSLIGTSLYEWMDPGVNVALEQLLERNEEQHELRFVLPNGRSTTLEFSLKAVGRDGLMMIFRDVSRRKAHEQALQHSEQRFRALIEYSQHVVLIIDSAFRIRYLSPSFSRQLQISPEKVLNTSLEQLVAEPFREALHTALESVIKKEGAQETLEDLVISSGDGVPYYYEATLTNLTHQPEIDGVVVNLHDISKRRRTEHQLDQINFELDSFIYKSSHDIRAPLMSILGLVNLARKATPEELPRYFDLMEKGVHRADTFIRDLTYFSRNDRMKIERKQINFHELVREIVGGLRHMQKLERVRVTVDMKSQEAFYSDPMRLAIVLTNLISNAVKYHDTNKYNPFVRLEVLVDQKQAVVRVQDNGSGIEAPYLDKIFDMFYRATELSDGSGLGLYVAQSVVKKLNGTLTVDSEFRQGSTFTLTLPNMKPTRAETLLAEDVEEESEDDGKIIPLHHRAPS